MFLDAIVPGDRTPYTKHHLKLTRSVLNLRLRLVIESYIQDEIGRVDMGPLTLIDLKRYPEMVRDMLINQTPVRIRHEVLSDLGQPATAAA